MRRDIVTTIGGLLLIGIVVVATFLYANQQRNDQKRHNQQAQKTEQQKSATNNQPNNQPATQPAPAAPNAATGTPQTGSHAAAAPVQSTTTPKTGGELLWILGIMVVGYLTLEYRRSRLRLLAALRS